jgi:predicted GH43/DUF377 family glycosyl hydrolase
MRVLLAFLATAAILAPAAPVPCDARFLGTWEYRQAAGAAFDDQGERLEFTCTGGTMGGLYFGLERAEEHGLFYTLVEMKDVRLTEGSGISFLVGERELFSQRPRSLDDIRQKRVTWSGVTRDTLVMRARLELGNLVVRCASTARLCPDNVMVFSKGSWTPPQRWTLGPFTKPAAGNPVITPDAASRFHSPMGDTTVAWEAYATFNPAAVVRNGKVYVLYRAEDATGARQIGGHTSRLGLAESSDGLHFTRRATPVLYPDTDAQRSNEWPGGVEDPRIVETDDGTYVLTYTQWNRDVPRLAVATSRDLVSWTKHGPAFARAAGGKYLRSESKSGAILSRVEGDRVIATRVNGNYWMYFGVPDLRIATSDNLTDWTPLEAPVLSPRPGYFDSWLVEAGPPALITDRGIVVVYNAGNSGENGDPSVPARAYTGGQALFDLHDPVKLIARSDVPFIRPTRDYERTGQYPEGTTFVEGLVPFKGRWFLYYGTADSRVGVAVSNR